MDEYKCKNCGHNKCLITSNEKYVASICEKCGYVEEIFQKKRAYKFRYHCK